MKPRDRVELVEVRVERGPHSCGQLARPPELTPGYPAGQPCYAVTFALVDADGAEICTFSERVRWRTDGDSLDLIVGAARVLLADRLRAYAAAVDPRDA